MLDIIIERKQKLATAKQLRPLLRRVRSFLAAW